MSYYYDLFDVEKEYVESREKAFSNIYDRLVRSHAIHKFKTVYGSGIRKLLEITGKNKGGILNGQDIVEALNPLGFDEEVVTFLVCILEAYNDEVEYRNRKIKVDAGVKERVINKRFNEYMKKGWQEFRKYQVLYTSIEDKKKFHDMKWALIGYNVMMKTFFTRRLPKRIPVTLYDKCVQCSDRMQLFYDRADEYAYISKIGKLERRNSRGIYTVFGQEVAFLFVLHFLHIK